MAAPTIKYEAEPVTFEESYRDGDIPKEVTASEYQVLTWILIKIGSVQVIRRDIDKGALSWPDIRDIIERRDSFIAYIQDQASGYEKVMGWMNQFAKEWSSLAVLKSPYTFAAYHTWALANGGVKSEFDRAIYHFTGFKRFGSAK